MNPITRTLNVDNLLLLALQEDISSEDVTTNAVMPKACQGTVQLLCKQDGVIAGMEVFARVFTLLDEQTEMIPYVKDGDEVKKGDLLATVNGDIRVLLSGERTALNYLQRMSGIATYTRSVAKLLEGSKTTLLDTRKTTPNMRIFEKYAVKIGGGQNHRYNLSDGVLLKDNHIGAAGSVTKAIEMARDYAPFVRKIEVECETLDMVREAADAGADIIMLDNMTPAQMKEAVAVINGRAKTECSGNVTKENIAMILDAGCVVLFAFWHVIADENKEKADNPIANKTDINCDADCVCVDGAADYQGGYRYDPQNKTDHLRADVLPLRIRKSENSGKNLQSGKKQRNTDHCHRFAAPAVWNIVCAKMGGNGVRHAIPEQKSDHHRKKRNECCQNQCCFIFFPHQKCLL